MPTSLGISGIFRPYHTVGGVFFYAQNLLRGFEKLLSDPELAAEYEVTVYHGRVPLLRNDSRLKSCRVADSFGRFATESKLALFHGSRLDAMLFLNYFRPPIVRARRSVTVIHDLQYRHMPQFFSPLKRGWLNSCHRLALNASDKVVTISEAVRQDLLNCYGAKWENRVVAIHNPVALDRFDKFGEQRFTQGRPYVMCVAIDRPQKNLVTLIRAFDRLKHRFPDHLLVLAGELRGSRNRWERSAEVEERLPAAQELIEKLNLQDRVVVTGFISDSDLGSLYRHTSLFVLPSLFEGFGMPAIEALAMGAPILTSGLPVLREVTLNAANYLDDPEDADAMADKVSAILSDPDANRPSRELIDNIRKHYDPANIAQQYIGVLVGN